MEIEVRKITKYAKRGAAIIRAKKRQEELRKEILEEMLQGLELPTHGPYVLALSQCGGKDFSWEDEYRFLLVKVFAKKRGLKVAQAMAEKKMKEMKEAAPNKESVELYGVEYVGGVKLEGKVNPDYRVQRVA